MTRSVPGLAVESSLRLPLTLLTRYLFFLTRRPISSANQHYLAQRLAGLRSLAPQLRAAGAEREATELEALTPWNFRHRSPRLLERLAETLAARPGDGFVRSERPPPQILEGSRRATVLYGPAIGIGDEILASRVVDHLSARAPACEIEIVSGYRDLWPALSGELPSRSYRDYRGFLGELERESREPVDLLILVDFEKPALSEAMARRPGIRYFVEISLGARSVSVVDAGEQWLHEYAAPSSYFESYYACVDHLADWVFGAGARSAPPSSRNWAPDDAGGRDRDPATIFVSPFTSKYEPDGRQWTVLLATLLAGTDLPVEVVLDSGPGEGTARFSEQLARSLQMTASSSIEPRVARSADGLPIDLADVVTAIRDCDLVLCADSFAAHLAPRLGTPSLVLAGDGLAHWKVPRAPAFYFVENGSARATAAAMALPLRQLIGSRLGSGSRSERAIEPLMLSRAKRVEELCRRLGELLEEIPPSEPLSGVDTGRSPTAGSIGGIVDLYQELEAAHRALVLDSAEWSRDLLHLLSDCRYDRVLPPARLASRGSAAADSARYVRDRWCSFVTTNLCKMLSLLHRGRSPEEPVS